MRIENVLTGSMAALLVAALTGCAAAPRVRPVKAGPVDTGAQTLASARQYLQGRWVLEAFEVRPPGKAPVALSGTGLLEYDDYGNLRMEIRADEAAAEALRAAGIEIRDGVISTEGRAAIDLQARTLTYFLEGQTAAGGGPLAMSRPRHWEVTADVLTLTTRDDGGTPLSVSRWKRSR